MKYKKVYGIDVSENNGVIDWSAVADSGAKFAIVRASYGRNGRDEYFQHNVISAQEHGLICGAYHYGYGLNISQAKEEAENCRAAIDESGVFLGLPVFYDMEDADGYKRRNGYDFINTTAICRAFLENIGLNAGIYASYSWLCDYIEWRSLNCPVWSAQWSKNDDFGGYMWQYTDNLIIGGKQFDGDILYQPEAE